MFNRNLRQTIFVIIAMWFVCLFIWLCSFQVRTLSGPAYSVEKDSPCGEVKLSIWFLPFKDSEIFLKQEVSFPDLDEVQPEQWEVSSITSYSVNEKRVFEITAFYMNPQTNSPEYCTIYYFPRECVVYMTYSDQIIVAPASSEKEALAAIDSIEKILPTNP